MTIICELEEGERKKLLSILNNILAFAWTEREENHRKPKYSCLLPSVKIGNLSNLEWEY
jgi:hypothetical protein